MLTVIILIYIYIYIFLTSKLTFWTFSESNALGSEELLRRLDENWVDSCHGN